MIKLLTKRVMDLETTVVSLQKQLRILQAVVDGRREDRGQQASGVQPGQSFDSISSSDD